MEQRRKLSKLTAREYDELVSRVYSMREQKMSLRGIAEQVGCSRKAVAKILLRPERLSAARLIEDAVPRRLGFCPNCGVRVLLPCVACRARANIANDEIMGRSRSFGDSSGDSADLRLDLPEDCAKRYQTHLNRKRAGVDAPEPD